MPSFQSAYIFLYIFLWQGVRSGTSPTSLEWTPPCAVPNWSSGKEIRDFNYRRGQVCHDDTSRCSASTSSICSWMCAARARGRCVFAIFAAMGFFLILFFMSAGKSRQPIANCGQNYRELRGQQSEALHFALRAKLSRTAGATIRSVAFCPAGKIIANCGDNNPKRCDLPITQRWTSRSRTYGGNNPKRCFLHVHVFFCPLHENNTSSYSSMRLAWAGQASRSNKQLRQAARTSSCTSSMQRI